MKKVELEVGFERKVRIIKYGGSKKTNEQRSGWKCSYCIWRSELDLRGLNERVCIGGC